MDVNSVWMLIRLIAEGVGVVKELSDLAKRIEAGEVISQEEIQKIRALIATAIGEFENAGKFDKEDEIENVENINGETE